MSRFNTRTVRPTAASPITTTGQTTVNHQGGTGHLREPKSELYLLAVANTVGTDTFYEQADQRDDRYTQLVHQLAVTDPDWTANLLTWLRSEANMRTAALVGAAEFVKARLAAGTVETAPAHPTVSLHGRTNTSAAAAYNRRVIDTVLQRPDEPGELLAYWTSRYGRNLPKPVKRGIADAVQRLYNGKSLLKYDTESKGYRFGDVLNLVHAAPHPDKAWQGDLFRHALDRRHNPDTAVVPASNRTLSANQLLRELPVGERRAFLGRPDAAERLTAAGFTWETLAGWLQGPMDRQAWEAIIPSMGYMALLRNLRNLDEAGVSDRIAADVAARIADPEQVARSRQFPFRFWAAYKHAPSLRWGHALEKGLAHSLANVPALGGRTLILVDRSPSMFPGFHFSTPNKSDIPLADQAAVFGAALAMRAPAPTLVEFGGQSREIPVTKGGSVLRLIEQFGQIDGTDIPSAVRRHYAGHDRVVIVTDEQTQPGWLPSNMQAYGGSVAVPIDDLIPKHVPVYMWNMAGYRPGAVVSGGQNRHALGGLTDHAFRMVPLLEAGVNGMWPWERKSIG